MIMRKTTPIRSAPVIAPCKPGRPVKGERRASIIEQIGEDRAKSLDGECGKPCEDLSGDELQTLYDAVAMEKGWHRGRQKPAF